MTGPLSDQQLDEAAALLARLDAVPSMGHLDSADLGWVRPVLHDLLDEVRRLRGENEQLSDLDDATSRRSELQAERDRAVTRWHEEHKRALAAEAALAEAREQVRAACCGPWHERELADQDAAKFPWERIRATREVASRWHAHAYRQVKNGPDGSTAAWAVAQTVLSLVLAELDYDGTQPQDGEAREDTSAAVEPAGDGAQP